MPWITPTGHEDPGNVWDNEPNAYDDNTNTYATVEVPPQAWSDYLILTHDPILCYAYRWWLTYDRAIDLVRFGALYDGTWHDSDDYPPYSETWWGLAFSQHETLQAIRITFHNSHKNLTYQARVHEADFGQVEAPPEPTLQAQDATNITTHNATLHGKVTDDAGYTLSLRFNYGKTTEYGHNTAWQTGKHTDDTIEQQVSDLEPATTYHFRVEAVIE